MGLEGAEREIRFGSLFWLRDNLASEAAEEGWQDNTRDHASNGP